MPPKKAKPAAAKKAPPMSQRALEELGMLPPLKDPRAAVGKELELLGSFWGDSCPARDRSKTFKCSIADFTLLHKPASGTPGPHFEVVVLGAGSERPSEPFFVQYPMPFLKHYYETFPGEKVVNKQTDHGAAAARDTAEADGGEEAEAAQAPHSSTSVYDHLTFVKSRKEGSRTISSFKCAINGCGSPVTIYGKSTGVFFKHCRRAAKQDTAHARVLEELNELSCRQVRLPSLALSPPSPPPPLPPPSPLPSPPYTYPYTYSVLVLVSYSYSYLYSMSSCVPAGASSLWRVCHCHEL